MAEKKIRRYGNWDKVAENAARCICQCNDGHGIFYQCLRKRGHGPKAEYCAQHAKMVADGKHVFVPRKT